MRIAELFVALGFKIEGREDFDAVARGLDLAAKSASVLAGNVDAAMGRLRASTAAAGEFRKATGQIVGGLKVANTEAAKFVTSLTAANQQLNQTTAAAAKVPPPLLKATKAVQQTTKAVTQVAPAAQKTTQSTASMGQSLQSATGKAAKLALAINGITYALIAMVEAGGRAGITLRNFALGTGLSTDELQRWQKAGVAAGLTAGTIQTAIEALNQTRAQFKLGEPQAVGAWQLLGVNPTQDPFVVLTKLRQRLARGELDAGVATNLLGRVGLEGLVPLLRSTESEFEKLRDALVISPAQIEKLSRFTAAWNGLKFSLASVRNQVSILLAPALVWLARVLDNGAEKMARFARWLDSGDARAKVIRRTLQILTIGMIALGVAIAGVTAAMTALLGILAAASLTPIVLAFGAFALVLGLVAAALVGLALLLDDFWTAAEGGKSFFQWNKGLLLTIDNVNRLAKALEWVAETYGKFTKLIDKNTNLRAFTLPGGVGPMLFGYEMLRRVKQNTTLFGGESPASRTSINPALVTPSAPSGPSVHQEINVDQRIDGARDPQAVGRSASRSIGDECSAALRQAPVPSR